jgi:hypothetical protein
MIRADHLRYITAAYLSGKGYYCELSPEVPDAACRPDLVAVKPRMKDVKLRFEIGGAPVGLIYMLLTNKWLSTEEILRHTGFDRSFIADVLDEANGNGWVKKKAGLNGSTDWALSLYKIPASECLMVMSAAEEPSAALGALHELQGSFDKAYLVFPYPIDDGFLNKCADQKTGVMVFDPKIADILIQLAAKRQKITKLKAYASVCESAIINHSISTTLQTY